MAARHERVGELQEQVVDVVALLGAHLEDVAEAARGDQAEARAAALDQGVGDQGGAVHDVADVGEGQVCAACSSSVEALQRADRRVVRRGQALVQADVVALRVEQDEVGEGAADVETDAIAGGGGHSGVLALRRLDCALRRRGSQACDFLAALERAVGVFFNTERRRATEATEEKHLNALRAKRGQDWWSAAGSPAFCRPQPVSPAGPLITGSRSTPKERPPPRPGRSA